MKEQKTDTALAKYRQLLALYGDTYRLLLATVNSPGGLAMVINLENHAEFWPVVVEEPAAKLVAALDKQPVQSLSLCWRPLGKGDYKRIESKPVARSVHSFDLPAATQDFEYYLEATSANGRKMIWPATAPNQNQTVIILP